LAKKKQQGKQEVGSMKTKRPATITLAVTAIALAILFIGIVDNPENSTVKNYFESANFTLIPSNATNTPQTPMTRIQLNTMQELVSQAQKLNKTTIYTEISSPTTVYSYGALIAKQTHYTIIALLHGLAWTLIRYTQ
jgi:hypothetical protein